MATYQPFKGRRSPRDDIQGSHQIPNAAPNRAGQAEERWEDFNPQNRPNTTFLPDRTAQIDAAGRTIVEAYGDVDRELEAKQAGFDESRSLLDWSNEQWASFAAEVGDEKADFVRQNADLLDSITRAQSDNQGMTNRVNDHISNMASWMPDFAAQQDANLATASEFREGLKSSVSSALSDIDARATEALELVKKGEFAAIQTAVQGVESRSRQADSQIQAAVARGEITQAQATQMQSANKTATGMEMSPIVGQIQHGFAKTAADTVTNFSTMMKDLHQTGLLEEGAIDRTALGAQAELFKSEASEWGAFTRMGASELAATERATSQIGAQLLQIQEGANANLGDFYAKMDTVLASAQNMNDTTSFNIMSTFQQPYAQYSGVSMLDYQLMGEIFDTDLRDSLMARGIDLSAEAIQAEGLSNALSSLFLGTTSGLGLPGWLAGIGAALLQLFQPKP